MRSNIVLTIGTTVILLVALGGCTAMAAECDMPLMVQRSTIPPNVMIILDSSGSMSEVLWHEDYDPYTTWSGTFDALTAYSIGSSGTYSPHSWNTYWATTPTVSLVTSTNGYAGRATGNYLNWLFYHATDQERAEQPQTTRMAVGKAAVQSLLASGAGMRFGLMRFNGDTGGTMVASIGTAATDISSAVNTIAPDSWTPTAETMVQVVNYFKRTDAGAPIQYSCQQNFLIVVTDGYPTQDLNMPYWIGDQDGDNNEPGNCSSIRAPEPNSSNCSDYMDDVAYYLAHKDLRSDLEGDQFVNVFTIGFGVDVDLLVDTAVNGNGTYQFAWDLASLTASLGNVVGDIVARISSGSAVAVVSTEQHANGYLYRSKFLPGPWRGYLEAFQLPMSDASLPQWEAGSLLANRAWSDRAVFTSLDGALVPFDPSQAANLASDLGVTDPDPDVALQEATDIIQYTLGDDVAGFRDRSGWKLGDMVYSTPLAVAGPAEFHLDESYQQFLLDHAGRTPVVYVGANDGMLHAFLAETGEELWAYVPNGLLGKLSGLADPAYCHLAYVDLSPVAYEVQINGSWHTVLVGGMRTGGDAYFALDITDPFNPDLLWETHVPEIGTSFTRPAIVRTPSATYLWTGSAPDPGGNASVALLDMSDGSVVFTSDVGTLFTDTNMMSTASVYDADWDGYSDYVYQGDLAGHLWRWDVTDPNPLNWAGEVLFSGSQPIQARPTLVLGYGGQLMVYFGTGHYVEDNDITDVSQQSFYCVRDDFGVTNLGRADLTNQTSSIGDVTNTNGWYIDLEMQSGERVIEPAAVIDRTVYFTSFAPTGDECAGGGYSWLYSLNFDNASNPDGPEDSTSNRVESLGSGVASKPVVDLVNGEVLVQTSDSRLTVTDIGTPRNILVNSWREKFDVQATGGQ
jgi:type IV pilus assembly protein PilY1